LFIMCELLRQFATIGPPLVLVQVLVLLLVLIAAPGLVRSWS